MAQDDVSDIQIIPPSGQPNDLSISPLPIRGEKRLVPVPIDPGGVTDDIQQKFEDFGLAPPNASVEEADFFLSAAKRTLVDYILVRIPHRGSVDRLQSATFRFLINPKTVSVSRQTVDAQSLTRAGWQFGVWGEDMVQVSLSGTTAGQYFALGLTNAYREFTESYRNLLSLQVVFENNGYWFEGEQAAEGPLAADFTRRRIKMHQDVQLVVGNHIFYGMFLGFAVQESAESPFRADFNLEFLAWKERFRQSSPYWNSIPNNVQRGHSYDAFLPYQQASQTEQLEPIPQLPPPASVQQTLTVSPLPPPPAGQQPLTSQDVSGTPVVGTDTLDSSPIDQIMNPTDGYWNG